MKGSEMGRGWGDSRPMRAGHGRGFVRVGGVKITIVATHRHNSCRTPPHWHSSGRGRSQWFISKEWNFLYFFSLSPILLLILLLLLCSFFCPARKKALMYFMLARVLMRRHTHTHTLPSFYHNVKNLPLSPSHYVILGSCCLICILSTHIIFNLVVFHHSQVHFKFEVS